MDCVAQAGHISRAIQLGVDLRQFEALALISESLTDNSDPRLLNIAASFFIDNAHYDRAVNVLAVAKRVCLQLGHAVAPLGLESGS